MACSRTLLKNILQTSRQLSASHRCLISSNVLVRHQHHEVSQLNQTKDITPVENELEHNIDLNPFAKVDETKSAFLDDLRPPLKRSYNFAAYVNSSETLQELVKLGVSLFDIENNDNAAAKHLALLDFKQDCAPYIKFLVDHGLRPKNVGRFISEFPSLFRVPLDDLNTRIEYLKMKGFSKKQIANALNRSCQIIANNVKSLDYKLGQFQIEFQLPANIIREIVSKYPPVISLPDGQYKMTNFTLKEEFGFKRDEIHQLFLGQPKILDVLRPVLIQRVDFIHNTIGLSHETICKYPKLLVGPIIEIRHRFLYLERLKRNQFDPLKPLYVPPSALYSLDDTKFCKQYAKTSLEDYKLFLRNC